MERVRTVSHPPRKAMEAATTIDETNTKRRNKWNLGSLFRRRKQASTKCEISDSSSETEEKQPRNFLGRRRKRTEKSLKPAPQWSGSANSLCSSEGFGSHSSLTRKDRRDLVKARVEAVRRTSSSEDDTSPNLPRFKSDDSLAHKKTRAARTERYLKRMSKEDLSISKSDIEVHHPQNWNATVVYKETSPFVRPVSSTPSPRMQHRILPQTSPQLRRSYCEAPRPPPEILHPNRSSSNISIAPNTNGLPNPMYFYRTQPPPPPPRDPQRKLLLYNGTPDYGFSRSRSDHSIQVTPEPPMLSNSSSQTQFTYLADKTPRSRRPIHVVPVPDQRHIGPEQRLIGAERHIVPEQQRHIGPEQRLIGAERHIVPEQRHIGPEQRLISSERHMVPEQQRHIGPEQRLIGAERHIVPEQRHIGSIHGQVPIIGHIPEQRHVIPERHTVPERLTISHAPHHLLPLEKLPLHHRGHEPSPECTMPAMPSWINDTPPSSEVRFDILKSEIPRIARQSRAVSAEVQMRTNKTPPPPPVRRYSRTSSMEDEPKRPPNNLEDALSELEAIYQSLRLGDEDLLDRAERRDLPTAHQNIKSDCNLDDIVIKRTQRAPPNRRSGIPDLVTDDMAYRRLNPAIPPITHDRQSGSYLLVSPTLSPIPAPNTDPEEPDTTFDDMSFRAIRTANSMKVIEHPPPFGIPLTPAPPAPDSDYLHVIPTDKFRPTLRPRKTPDIVKDDLAFRNLRKDNKLAEIKRKRAVRSLSANLMSLMEQQDLEKTQSLNCLPHSLQALIDNNRPPPSWVERANLLDSTETLTQSRANLRSLRNSFFADTRPNSLYQVQEDPVPAPLNEERLEEMLSALAKEAHDTSERLGLELERLRDGSKSVEGKPCYVPVYPQDLNNNKSHSINTVVNSNSEPPISKHASSLNSISEHDNYNRALCTILEESNNDSPPPTITIEELTSLPDLINSQNIDIEFNEVYKLNINTQKEENVIHEISTTMTELRLKPLNSTEIIDDDDDDEKICIKISSDDISIIPDIYYETDTVNSDPDIKSAECDVTVIQNVNCKIDTKSVDEIHIGVTNFNEPVTNLESEIMISHTQDESLKFDTTNLDDKNDSKISSTTDYLQINSEINISIDKSSSKTHLKIDSIDTLLINSQPNTSIDEITCKNPEKTIIIEDCLFTNSKTIEDLSSKNIETTCKPDLIVDYLLETNTSTSVKNIETEYKIDCTDKFLTSSNPIDELDCQNVDIKCEIQHASDSNFDTNNSIDGIKSETNTTIKSTKIETITDDFKPKINGPTTDCLLTTNFSEYENNNNNEFDQTNEESMTYIDDPNDQDLIQGEIMASDLGLAKFHQNLANQASNVDPGLVDFDLLAFLGAVVALVSILTALSIVAR
ncbi:hypothetical protein B566_EDAN008177 [Ephemera danica]|nr:hypothetical protein B566_EDAN008177 [Ephemera danica]